MTLARGGYEAAGTSRPDLRLVPVAAAVWACALVGTGGRPLAVVTCAVVAVTMLVWARARRRWWVLATAATALVALGVSAAAVATLHASPVRRLAVERAVGEVELDVRVDPGFKPGGQRRGDFCVLRGMATTVDARGARLATRQPVIVLVSGDGARVASRLVVGSRVVVVGRLEPPEPGDNVVAVVKARDGPRLVGSPGFALRAVERVRAGLRDAVDSRPPEPKALVPALVLGDSSRMSEAVTADFRTTGLTHLTAVSGANLSLLLAFVMAMGRWAGLRGWWLRGLGPLSVIVFVALCRTESSVLRAAAMGVVAWAAIGQGATGNKGARHLSAAVIALLLFDPWLARSVGFGLSVFASAGIIGWARVWAERMTWLPGWVAEAVAVPLAAQLTTQPLVTAISGHVSLVGLLANAAAGPLVGPATVLGFAAAGASQLSRPIAALLGWAASWCAQAILWVAHLGAHAPGAAMRWPVSPASLVLLGTACVLAGLMMSMLLQRRWLVIVVALGVTAALLRSPTPLGWPGRHWAVVVCDVGQGDAVVLNAGQHQAVLVDTGPEPAALTACLRGLGVRAVPLVILSHFHADHIGGISALRGFPVRRVVVSPLRSPAGGVAAVARLVDDLHLPMTMARVGETLRAGQVEWRTLAAQVPSEPPSDTDGESSVENDSSVTGVAAVGGVRVLLTGDLGPDGQRPVTSSLAAERINVLKVPHHGSSHQDASFLSSSGAKIALYSAGYRNDYGHPSVRTVRTTESLGMVTLRTDLQGSIAVGESDGRFEVRVQRNGPP